MIIKFSLTGMLFILCWGCNSGKSQEIVTFYLNERTDALVHTEAEFELQGVAELNVPIRQVDRTDPGNNETGYVLTNASSAKKDATYGLTYSLRTKGAGEAILAVRIFRKDASGNFTSSYMNPGETTLTYGSAEELKRKTDEYLLRIMTKCHPPGR